jgi:hypothetical protein
MTRNVIPFKQPPLPKRPTAEALRLRIRQIAKDTSRLRFDHPHIQKRMQERDISMRQVLEALRNGTVVSGPEKDKYGDWRIKLRRLVAGKRVQVVVALNEGDFATVVTAID